MIGTIQWTFGVHVQANQISPTGISIAAKQTTDTIDSGGRSPVTGSVLCELMTLRMSGSHAMTIVDPTPMPQNERPVKPGDHPRKPSKTIGYATKHRYKMP